jgi:penicillin-binding protein 1A
MRGRRVEAGPQAERACTSVRDLVLRALGFLAFAVIVFAAVGVGFSWWFDRHYSADLHAVLAARPPLVRILDRNGVLIASYTQRQPHIAIALLPRHLIDAVTSTEDRRFDEHWGIDPVGLGRAFWRNLATGQFREGGSTITQQLAKNIYLGRERTLSRKFRELVVSLWLERHFDKRQILELYLNRVYFGAGATYGIEAAARRYFDKSARNLTLAEAAMLAGTLKAPNYFSPTRNLARSQERAAQVLDNMLATGAISAAEADAARQQPARIIGRPARSPLGKGSEYAEDWIMEQLKERLGATETDLTVTTTLDLPLQRQAQKLARNAITTEGRARHVDQVAALLLDATGGVRLMVGGTDYAASQFNRTLQARRQPGSSFKPIVYLAAMEAGMTPSTLRPDAPVSIDGWQPRNASGGYRGEVSLRTALAHSVNSVAVSLANEIGLDKVIHTARRLGIHSPLTRRASLALGTSELSPLELTAAYVPMMNGGYGIEPHIIDTIVDGHGAVVYRHDDRLQDQVIASAYIYDMNEMLGAVIGEGTGREAQLPGHAIAGKTGTSQDCRDAWFIGYSGHFTASVWMGNDNSDPTDRVSGGSLPAKLWSQLMQLAHQGLAPRELPGLALPGDGAPTGIMVEPQLPAASIVING